jgi:ethanolamine ammonia-lyase small subunit
MPEPVVPAVTPPSPAPTPDPWAELRALTPARVALGRAGVGVPTAAHLAFQLAHARARDAVQAALDVPALQARLARDGIPTVVVQSAVPDRQTYLERPDLGRRPDAADLAALVPPGDGQPIAALVLAGGLSAHAVDAHAPGLVAALSAALAADGWLVAPVVVVEFGRVAIGDAIGARLGASLVIVLIGERPGLSAADSLGAYLTFAPRVGRTDAERECVSNIRTAGLPPADAADRLRAMAAAALARGASGVHRAV